MISIVFEILLFELCLKSFECFQELRKPYEPSIGLIQMFFSKKFTQFESQFTEQMFKQKKREKNNLSLN